MGEVSRCWARFDEVLRGLVRFCGVSRGLAGFLARFGEVFGEVFGKVLMTDISKGKYAVY